jgi:hypothetical protein
LNDEDLDDLRRRIRNAVRAVGRRPSRGAIRWFDRVFASWQSEEIQKVVAHLPAAKEDKVLGVAMMYNKLQAQRTKRDLHLQAQRTHEKRVATLQRKLAPRNEWIRSTYGQAMKMKNGKPYPVEQFRMDLEFGRVKIPRGFGALLRPHRKLISRERLRQIIEVS